jgi:hypothetical protein
MMQEPSYKLLSDEDYVSVLELSQLLCVPEKLIIEWIEHEVICAKVQQGDYYISSGEIAKAKCAARMTLDLGVNASGIAIILRMRQRIQQLEVIVNRRL